MTLFDPCGALVDRDLLASVSLRCACVDHHSFLDVDPCDARESSSYVLALYLASTSHDRSDSSEAPSPPHRVLASNRKPFWFAPLASEIVGRGVAEHAPQLFQPGWMPSLGNQLQQW